LSLDELALSLWQHGPPAASDPCVCCRQVGCTACLAEAERRLCQAQARMTEAPNLLRAALAGLGAALLAAAGWVFLCLQWRVESALYGVLMAWLIGPAVMWGAGGKRGRAVQAVSLACAVGAVAGGLGGQNLALWARLIATGAVSWTPWGQRLVASAAGLPTSIAVRGLLFWGLLAMAGILAWRIPQAPARPRSKQNVGWTG
jgi:hypothetical protein